MSAYEALIDLLGSPPTGLEPLAYAMAGFCLIFILNSAFGLLSVILRGK